MSPAQSFPPLSGSPAPCAVPVSSWLSLRAVHFGFLQTVVRTLYTEKRPCHTHTQKGPGGGGGGERPAVYGTADCGRDNPKEKEAEPPAVGWPISGGPNGTPAPAGDNEPTPPHHRTHRRTPAHQRTTTQPSRVPHWGPGGGQNGRGKTPPPAQGRRSRRAPPPGGNSNNGLDAQAHGTGAPRDAHTLLTREGPNTSPHHSGLATEAPAASRPARKGPERPTNPTRGGWARRGRDRPCPENPPLRRAGPPPEG